MFKDSENIKGVQDFERRMNTFFNLLVGPSLLAFIVLYLELKTSEPEQINPSPSGMIYIVVACLVLILSFAEIQFKKDIRKISRDMPLQEKLSSYLPAYRLRGSLATFTIVIILTALFLEKHSIYTLLFFVAFGYLSLVRPSQKKLSKHLKFTKEDIEMMESYAEFDES